MGKQVTTTSGLVATVCDTPVVNPVGASQTAVTLMGANPDRVHGQIYNNSSSLMYVKWGPGASSTSFTTRIAPYGLYELPRVNQYIGEVSGAWVTATGNAMVTEAM